MDGIRLQSFIDMVSSASVLDGDVRLAQDNLHLEKVNYGGWFARLALGSMSNRNEVTTEAENRAIREAFANAIINHFGDKITADVVNKVAKMILGEVGNELTAKPLSRRTIKQTLVSLNLVNDQTQGLKSVGGEAGMKLTKAQFAGMVKQTLVLAEKRTIDVKGFQKKVADLGASLGSLAKKQGSIDKLKGQLGDPASDEKTNRQISNLSREVFAMTKQIATQEKALAAMLKGKDLPSLESYFAPGTKDLTADGLTRLEADVTARAMSNLQFKAMKQLVAQCQVCYDRGQTVKEIAPFLGDGLDLASVADAIIKDVKDAKFIMPHRVDTPQRTYAQRTVHAATEALCAKVADVNAFVETEGAGRLDELVQYGGDVQKERRADVDRLNAFLGDFILNEDPLEVEQCQLGNGERLGRVFLKHFDVFSEICRDVDAHERVGGGANPLPMGIQRLKDLLGTDFANALVDLVKKINAKVFTPDGAKPLTVPVKPDMVAFYASAQDIFKLIGASKIEQTLDAALRADSDIDREVADFALRKGNTCQCILDDLGIGRPGGSVEDQLLRTCIRQTFQKSDVLSLRKLYASGFRNSTAQKDFDTSAMLLGAGPLLQKLLQGHDSTKATTQAAKHLLDTLGDNMPPISSDIVKAELFNVVQKHAATFGEGKTIANISVERSLGAATLAEAFLCTVTLKEGAATTSVSCVVKVQRPDSVEKFAFEAEAFRAGVDELVASKTGDSTAVNAVFLSKIQAVRAELSLADELRKVVRGVRAYQQQPPPASIVGEDGSQIDGLDEKSGVSTMLPLLKDGSPEGVEAFLNAVRQAQPFDEAAIDDILATHCVAPSETLMFVEQIKGDTLIHQIHDEQKKLANPEDFVKARVKETPVTLATIEADKPLVIGGGMYERAKSADLQDRQTTILSDMGTIDQMNDVLIDQIKRLRPALAKCQYHNSFARQFLSTVGVKSLSFEDFLLKFDQDGRIVRDDVFDMAFDETWNEFFRPDNEEEAEAMVAELKNLYSESTFLEDFKNDLLTHLTTIADMQSRLDEEEPFKVTDFYDPPSPDKVDGYEAEIVARYRENSATVEKAQQFLSDIELDHKNFDGELQRLAQDVPEDFVGTDDDEVKFADYVDGNTPENKVSEAIKAYTEKLESTFKDRTDRLLTEHTKKLQGLMQSTLQTFEKDWDTGVKQSYTSLLQMLKDLVEGVTNGKPPFIHGDSHSGNIMRGKDGKLHFIDYGRGTTLTEPEAHAFVKILSVISHPDNDLSELVMSAYREIIDEKYKEIVDGKSSPADANARAEFELIRSTHQQLHDPQVMNRLIVACHADLYGQGAGSNVVAGLGKFNSVILGNGLYYPQTMGNFIDTFVKIGNAANDLSAITERYRQTEIRLRNETALKYLQSMVADANQVDGPLLDVVDGKIFQRRLFDGLRLDFGNINLDNVHVSKEGVVCSRDGTPVEIWQTLDGLIKSLEETPVDVVDSGRTTQSDRDNVYTSNFYIDFMQGDDEFTSTDPMITANHSRNYALERQMKLKYLRNIRDMFSKVFQDITGQTSQILPSDHAISHHYADNMSLFQTRFPEDAQHPGSAKKNEILRSYSSPASVINLATRNAPGSITQENAKDPLERLFAAVLSPATDVRGEQKKFDALHAQARLGLRVRARQFFAANPGIEMSDGLVDKVVEEFLKKIEDDPDWLLKVATSLRDTASDDEDQQGVAETYRVREKRINALQSDADRLRHFAGGLGDDTDLLVHAMKLVYQDMS